MFDAFGVMVDVSRNAVEAGVKERFALAAEKLQRAAKRNPAQRV